VLTSVPRNSPRVQFRQARASRAHLPRLALQLPARVAETLAQVVVPPALAEPDKVVAATHE
jgi:hypothetical protein